ncbi:MAG: NADP-dependent malic enzyme [Alphaproteobacteria bacterium]
MSDDSDRILDQEALAFHMQGRPGKIEITPTKPLVTQRDLSLAYSPGVAAPCLAIAEDPSKAFDYTARGNMVAIITNGTAVLGLGNLGALASKPVMEGKSVLFKRFADIDAIDLELDTTDVDEFVNAVRYLGPSFGGINLEDIKAPECFIIEQRLREIMDIPVFHDDQHGTAIIAAAGLLNALDVTGRNIKNIKMVVNGAGAGAIACVELAKSIGVPHENIIMCDTAGVIYQGREERMNQWKSAHAVPTKARTLSDAMKGADVFFGLSVKGAVSADMVKSMGKKPIIFAMANPDPEIKPEEARAVRPDAIIATGRSDYPNQVNNVLGFPYIFRGALDVRARAINDEMKVAAANALAALAREDVPDEVSTAYQGAEMRYGPEYLIPVPFDPRLISAISPAVAQAAMDTGVAELPIEDMAEYKTRLSERLDPTADALHLISREVRANPRRVVFAEGEEEKAIRAAAAFKAAGYGTPILVGYEDRILETMKRIGIANAQDFEISNAGKLNRSKEFTDFMYDRLARRGMLYRDCQRLVNQDRNIFAACMVAHGDADAMVTGLTRSSFVCLNDVRRVLDPRPGERVFGLTMLVTPGRTVFIADTSVHEVPNQVELADIAVQAAAKARQLGHTPRVALLSFSTFGEPLRDNGKRIREAVDILDSRKVDFEYDGEMAADVALDPELMHQHYPFCRLSGPANILIMPALDPANISSKLMQELGGGTVIGPLLLGLEKPAQIVQMGATVSQMVTLAALGVHESLHNE